MLLKLNLFTKEQVRETLCSNIGSIKPGELLVKLGQLKPIELQATLSIRRDGGHTIVAGEVLVRQCYIEEYTPAGAVAFQLGYRYLDLDPETVNCERLANMAQHSPKHSFARVREEEGKVSALKRGVPG